MGWTGRNQWTGSVRCGATKQAGRYKGQPCGRVALYKVGPRVLCKAHADQARRQASGERQEVPV